DAGFYFRKSEVLDASFAHFDNNILLNLQGIKKRCGKINYRHRLTQINTDKMKRAMPLKICPPAQQKRKNPCKSVSQTEGSYTLYTIKNE
ncbi:MAG: hypothetical protein KAT65_25705, partial [Methanophagales archaeon]|nr:hypothetical protein [Methanophagales archaeon]